MSRLNNRGFTGLQVDIKLVDWPLVMPVLKKHGKADEAIALVADSKRYGNTSITVPLQDFSPELCKELAEVFTSDIQLRLYLRACSKIVSGNPSSVIVRNLELLPAVIWRYLLEDAIDGWIYEEIMDGVHVAYVVESIEYHPAQYDRSPPYVSMTIQANKAEFNGEEMAHKGSGLLKKHITFSHGDLGGSVGVLLLHEGFLKETEDLKRAYSEYLETFSLYQPRFSHQFLCTGTALDTDTGSWWSRDKRYKLPHPTKMVLEEEVLQRKLTTTINNYIIKQEFKFKGEVFGRIPVHPFLLFFDLTRHDHCWIHVTSCAPYVYDKELKSKLVLPERHRDLIDVLTTDMDIFVEDIVAGKSGGTAILCYGNPGLGKTLTAEVYSEIVGRPLYRVHAGQLGIDVDTIESILETILRRSERWGAVLLIDEADVYIRRRGDDIRHNAVVAAFLRVLEYFHGLLFLTTNRMNDVDDAIQSRMIAMFKYELPDKAQAAQLWTILARQFGIIISAKAVAELVQEFPTASGRDIKQLLKLTQKYCKYKKKPLSVEAFRICAMFRGVA